MLSRTHRARAVALLEASEQRSDRTAWCRMSFYLPVADVSASVFTLPAKGGAV